MSLSFLPSFLQVKIYFSLLKTSSVMSSNFFGPIGRLFLQRYILYTAALGVGKVILFPYSYTCPKASLKLWESFLEAKHSINKSLHFPFFIGLGPLVLCSLFYSESSLTDTFCFCLPLLPLYPCFLALNYSNLWRPLLLWDGDLLLLLVIDGQFVKKKYYLLCYLSYFYLRLLIVSIFHIFHLPYSLPSHCISLSSFVLRFLCLRH